MIIDLGVARLRPFEATDAASIATHANDRALWRNMGDTFPHPYALSDAEQFLALVATGTAVVRAIEVDGAAVGALGLHPRGDVYRRSAELGYWLARPFRRRGIVTRAVGAMQQLATQLPDLLRVEAGVFGWNQASMKVLQRNGFVLEGVQRDAVYKDGEITDLHLYGHMLRAP